MLYGCWTAKSINPRKEGCLPLREENWTSASLWAPLPGTQPGAQWTNEASCVFSKMYPNWEWGREREMTQRDWEAEQSWPESSVGLCQDPLSLPQILMPLEECASWGVGRYGMQVSVNLSQHNSLQRPLGRWRAQAACLSLYPGQSCEAEHRRCEHFLHSQTNQLPAALQMQSVQLEASISTLSIIPFS